MHVRYVFLFKQGMDDHGCVLLGSVLRSTEACVYSVCGIIGGKRLIGFLTCFGRVCCRSGLFLFSWTL